MKLKSRGVRFPRQMLILLMLGTLLTGPVSAAELGVPNLAEPLQKEKFFDPARFCFTDSQDSVKPAVQPHFSVSHDTREDNIGLGVKQTIQRVHGEAGGRLNFLGDISLTTFARVPVFTKETVGSPKATDGVSSSELFKNTGRLSWRSELGIPVRKGVDLNIFYDNSTIGKIDKPGVEEREEKFGTRFIFKFK